MELKLTEDANKTLASENTANTNTNTNSNTSTYGDPSANTYNSSSTYNSTNTYNSTASNNYGSPDPFMDDLYSDPQPYVQTNTNTKPQKEKSPTEGLDIMRYIIYVVIGLSCLEMLIFMIFPGTTIRSLSSMVSILMFLVSGVDIVMLFLATGFDFIALILWFLFRPGYFVRRAYILGDNTLVFWGYIIFYAIFFIVGLLQIGAILAA